MGEVAAVLSPVRNTASVVPIFLIESTLRAAMKTGAGGLAKAILAAMQLAKLKVSAAAVLAFCLLGAGTTWFTAVAPVGGGGAAVNSVHGVDAEWQQAARPTASGIAREEKKSDAAPYAHTGDVCKTDAVQRLRELIEQVLLGSHKDKTPGLTAEPRTERCAHGGVAGEASRRVYPGGLRSDGGGKPRRSPQNGAPTAKRNCVGASPSIDCATSKRSIVRSTKPNQFTSSRNPTPTSCAVGPTAWPLRYALPTS